MLVKELIKKLIEEDQDREIILAKEGPKGQWEDNDYSPLSSLWTAAYTPSSAWAGKVQLEPNDLTDEMTDSGYTEEDIVEGEEGKDWNKALVLTPVN